MKYIIMGVAGSGKSSVGRALARKINYTFIEGDDLHSNENKLKMSRGVHLTDNDRVPWLKKINKLLRSPDENIIVSCSALKKEYRSILNDKINDVTYIFLTILPSLAEERVKNRSEHFFSPSLIYSQFRLLEPPENAIIVDASLTVDQIVKIVINKTGL